MKKTMVAIFCLLLGLLAHADSLTTKAELTGYKETGRYDEVIRLCAEFQRAYPHKVRCIDFGVTPEGRPMKALIVSGTGHFKPKEAHLSGVPVLFFQGGIHAGEIDGKDAMFAWLRDILKKKSAVLNAVTLVLVPVF